MTLEQLFDRCMPEPNSGCWLWYGAVQGGDYGVAEHEGRTRIAHRLAYELACGPIPDGLVIDHKCRVHSCVNPSHLEPVKQRVNVMRGVGITKQNAVKTHCKNGHEFSGANLGHVIRGGRLCRRCRACSAEITRVARAAKCQFRSIA
jgi:hypothetical protein